jgi:hypothetical protein
MRVYSIKLSAFSLLGESLATFWGHCSQSPECPLSEQVVHCHHMLHAVSSIAELCFCHLDLLPPFLLLAHALARSETKDRC